MPSPLIISKAEKDILEILKTDNTTANASGVQLDESGDGSANTPYCSSIVPIPDYSTLVPAGSEIETMTFDGAKLAALTAVRYLMPVFFQTETIGFSPTISISSLVEIPTEIISYGIPTADRLKITRKAQISCNFTALGGSDSLLNYKVKINDTESSILQFPFSNTGISCIVGSWIMDIPSGPVTIKFLAQNMAGSNVDFNSNCFAQISIIG